MALLLLGAVPAVAQDERGILLRGELDGRAIEARLLPPAEERPLRVALEGWRGEGEALGRRSYRVTLRRLRAVGAAGRLAGLESEAGETLSLILTRGAAGAVDGVLYRDGAAVGRLSRARAEPAPAPPAQPAEPAPAECKPTRDAWWARHGVATWGFGRALWDFFKPGGRRLEELRADITPDESAALLADLERRAPKPWGPAAIFRAARARTPDDRTALQLCFALLVDQRRLPLRRLPGNAEDEPIHDKYEHFFASAILAHRSNARGSFAVGWLKEVLDEVSGSGYSEEDLMADALGAEFGQALLCGQVLDP